MLIRTSPVVFWGWIFASLQVISFIKIQISSDHNFIDGNIVDDSTTIDFQLDQNGFGFPHPMHLDDRNTYIHWSLWATQYYLYQAPYADNGYSLRNLEGKSTGAKLELCDWCSAAIERTLYTTDSSGQQITLNVVGKSSVAQVDCSMCLKYETYRKLGIRNALWYVARGKYGDGVNGYSLVPYRSIAVDKTSIPIGNLLFIPDACGIRVTCPDGTTSIHDGYFLAVDVGSNILQNHIDVFTGINRNTVLPFVTSRSDKPFTAYQVSHAAIFEALK